MQVGPLFMLPGSLNNRGLGKIEYLFLYVQLYESIRLFFVVINTIELISVNTVYVFDIAKPHIQYRFKISIGSCCFNTSATIMTTNDHMFYFQVIDRIVENAQ